VVALPDLVAAESLVEEEGLGSEWLSLTQHSHLINKIHNFTESAFLAWFSSIITADVFLLLDSKKAGDIDLVQVRDGLT
jgi:hypothetical protein